MNVLKSLGAAVLFCVASASEQAATPAQSRDLQCMGAISVLAKSTDPKIQSSAPVVYAFYLGRLDQMGLTPAQIQSGLEAIALSPDSGARTQQPGFVAACLKDVNDRIEAMNRQGAKDWNARAGR